MSTTLVDVNKKGKVMMNWSAFSSIGGLFVGVASLLGVILTIGDTDSSDVHQVRLAGTLIDIQKDINESKILIYELKHELDKVKVNSSDGYSKQTSPLNELYAFSPNVRGNSLSSVTPNFNVEKGFIMPPQLISINKPKPLMSTEPLDLKTISVTEGDVKVHGLVNLRARCPRWYESTKQINKIPILTTLEETTSVNFISEKKLPFGPNWWTVSVNKEGVKYIGCAVAEDGGEAVLSKIN